jgi:hypothetical protein
MKNKNNKKNNKKFKLGLFIKISVALMLLISMTISFSSGTAVAEFVKTFSANIDFEGIPSPPWSYYLKDQNNQSGKTGTYATYNKISQDIVIGDDVAPAALVYEIKMPVKGTGLYTVDFTVKFTAKSVTGGTWSGFVCSTKEGSLNKPVGCKINTKTTKFTEKPTVLMKDSVTKLNYNRRPVFGPDPCNEHKAPNASGTLNAINYDNYFDYQWKTLAPSRKENVSLTFYINNASNVAIWSWDLRGLGDKNDNSGNIVNGTYTLSLTNISIKKIDAPDANEPYLDFADTHWVNNTLSADGNSHLETVDEKTNVDYNPPGAPGFFNVTSGPSGNITGKAESGKTRYAVARGTYVTEATYNSMTMQAEKLVYGYRNGTEMVTSTLMDNERYSNLVSFGIPIKNVKAGKSYKITYDVGFARQGSMDVQNGRSKYDYVNYADHGNIFAIKEGKESDDDNDKKLHMESYLYRGIKENSTYNVEKITVNNKKKTDDYGLSQVFSIPAVTNTYYGRGNFYDPKMALYNTGAEVLGNTNKGQAKSRYNEMWYVKKGKNYISEMSTATSVNDLENISTNALFNTDSIGKYNWYNAIRHTETNGENSINWITFTNNTFTFTISSTDYYEGNIGQLRWIWAIDGFEEKSWYRIKFDNVRIEEVVTYGSNIANDSLGFNSTSAGYRTYEDIGLFRGANGTGQNYTARGYEAATPLANMNLYAPIYDAKGKTVIDSNNDQRISLSGYAVCKGGVEKYVWSADGGETWYDMESQRVSDATDAVRLLAEEHAENSTIGLTGKHTNTKGVRAKYGSYICEYATFTAVDGVNGQFEITANLKGTPYAGKTGLNIIFAAVPFSNSSARLELIRITNYNS